MAQQTPALNNDNNSSNNTNNAQFTKRKIVFNSCRRRRRYAQNLARDRESPETAKLAARRWADELFTVGWWNWHLWPQALYFAMPDGSPRAMDLV